MTAPDEIYRQGNELAGEIAVDFYDDFWAKLRYRYGNPPVEYEPLGSDEIDADDPYLTVLRRKSDGQLFAIEIEVMARPMEAPQPQREIPGQMTLAEVAS